MSLDIATLTLVKKVRNLQHENLPIQDINFPTKNSKSPDLGSRVYHMYGDCTIRVAKTKALISFAFTAKLICVFVFAYAKRLFSHGVAQLANSNFYITILISAHSFLKQG